MTLHPPSENCVRVKMIFFLGKRSRGHSLKFHPARERLIGKPCRGNRLSIPRTVIRFDNALRSDDVAIAVRDNRNKFPTPFAANARSACGFHQHSDWRLNQPAFFIDVSLFRSCSLLLFLPVCLSLHTCVVSRVQPCVQHLLGSARDRESSIYERARVNSASKFHELWLIYS